MHKKRGPRQVLAYLGADVLERSRGDDREANKEDVRLRVREGAEPVVIFLPGSIPETQVDGLPVDHDIRRVVVEHGGNVLARKGVGCVADQQARLADGAVAHHDTLNGLHTGYTTQAQPQVKKGGGRNDEQQGHAGRGRSQGQQLRR
jgi:hypothetical protein